MDFEREKHRNESTRGSFKYAIEKQKMVLDAQPCNWNIKCSYVNNKASYMDKRRNDFLTTTSEETKHKLSF